MIVLKEKFVIIFIVVKYGYNVCCCIEVFIVSGFKVCYNVWVIFFMFMLFVFDVKGVKVIVGVRFVIYDG